jgi:hypothetical protein
VVANFESYSDKKYQVNSQDAYFPLQAKITITKNGVKIVGVDYSGSFSNGDFPTPQDVSLTINLAPYNYKLTVKQLNSLQFSVKAEVGCAAVLDATVTFSSSDYKNLNVERDLSKIDFTYTKDNFIIKGNWDAKIYYMINNPNTSDINSTISCTVYNGNAKIGDLKFKDIAGERKVYVYYKDGTSEDSFVTYDPFLATLKSILKPYFGNQVDHWF